MITLKYLSVNAYKKELEKAKKESKQKELRLKLQTERNKWKGKKVKMETNKKLAIYLFILMNVIIVYCLIAMWYFADLSYLGVMISDIAAQVLIYGIYCLKAYKGKKAEEEMKLEFHKLKELDGLAEMGESVTGEGNASGIDVSKLED